ncbi:MAG: choice-of-anchor D domain-containing protein [Spirochaetales bacterium]|nr:choice-of-anchor D domain-containing protein [Spirochaetales bacterium]
MNKLSVLLIVVFLSLSGCNLIIGLIGSEDEGIIVEPLPAEIAILNGSYSIPYNNPSFPIGSTVAGTEKIINFTIENRGEETLNLYDDPHVLLSGEGFSFIKDAEANILSGSTSLFSISFQPPVSGTYQALISVKSNDTGRSPYQFTIISTGTESAVPELSIRNGNAIMQSGTVVNFGEFKIGNEKNKIFHLKNIGSADLVLVKEERYVTMDGEGFFPVSDAVSPVLPDTEITYQIGFLPVRVDTFNATVHIKSNDPEVPDFVYYLEGYGIE